MPWTQRTASSIAAVIDGAGHAIRSDAGSDVTLMGSPLFLVVFWLPAVGLLVVAFLYCRWLLFGSNPYD